MVSTAQDSPGELMKEVTRQCVVVRVARQLRERVCWSAQLRGGAGGGWAVLQSCQTTVEPVSAGLLSPQ